MVNRQKHKTNYRWVVFTVIGILLAGMIAAGILLQRRNQEQTSFAASGNCSGDGESDGQGCQFGGDPRNGCDWICPGNIIPSCCDKLAETGDPTVCCFDARRRCTPGQCSAIPEGVRKERCGQLWEIGGYCPHGSNPTQAVEPSLPPPTATIFSVFPTSTPVPIIIPTEVPQPTLPSLPEVQPTQVAKLPQERPQITYIPIIIPPYTSPTLTPTPTPFKLNIPNFLPPKEKVQSFLEGIRLNLMDFFSKILP